jgi:DNA-directed RNA polymerase beta subunit
MNVDVAFMANAENQADELIFNQGAIDRGAFTVHHIVSKIIKPESTSAAFGIPDFSKVYSAVAPMDAYQKVDPITGTPKVLGERFKQGDVIAAITEPLSPADIEDLRKSRGIGGSDIVYTKRDVSITHPADHCPEERHPTYARLTASYSSIGSNDRVRTLQFATVRYAKEGDKFSSEHGQKGVCGPTKAECDMPYNEDGIRAVIEFNPPAAVRRETHGQLAFAVLGKICALLGTSLEMSPFLNRVYTGGAPGIPPISGILEELGMDPRGTEKMFNPITGEPYEDPIFFGVLAYMRLRRMVDDLRQYRYHGAREFYSRQPVKGAARHGGVTVGEMERNAIIASGASGVARDCHFEQAAPVDRYICDRCYRLAYPSPTTPGVITCDRCGNLDPAVSHAVRVPYNLPLLSVVLEGAGCSLETMTDAAYTTPV